MFPDSAVYALSGVAALSTVAGRYVLALLAPDRTVRVFDRKGAFVRDIGREGRGPGEFINPGGMTVLADSVVAVFDRQLQVLSLFRVDGSLISATHVAVSMFGHGLVLGLGALTPETLVFEVYTGYGQPSRPGVDGTGALLRVSTDGSRVDSLIAFEGPQALVHAGLGRYPLVFPAPFARAPYWDVGPRGRLAFGHSDEPWIRFYGEDGTPLDSLRLDGPPEPIASEDIEAFRSAFDGETGGARTDPRFRRIADEVLRSVRYPRTWPWFDALRHDPCGRLWVRRVRPREGAAVWDLYDSQLQYLGQARTPAGVRIHVVESDGVWGTRTDSLGVVRIQRYPFVR